MLNSGITYLFSLSDTTAYTLEPQMLSQYDPNRNRFKHRKFQKRFRFGVRAGRDFLINIIDSGTGKIHHKIWCSISEQKNEL